MIVLFSAVSNVSSSKFVFTKFHNDTGFSSEFYASILGFLTPLYSQSGFEGGAHLSEETSNANKETPRVMISTILISSVIGLIFIITFLYCMDERINYIVNGAYEQPTVNLFWLVYDKDKTPTIITSFVYLLTVFLPGFCGVTVTSRIGYAMARDNALPYSDYLKHLNPQSGQPDRMILFVFIATSIFVMTPLLSDTAFTAITSIATIGI